MSPRTAIIILLLAVAPFLALSLPFYSWIPDDAYISFQYARSFAEGDGLVFNPDERVEGFSNPLWTLLLAAVARLGRDIEVVAPLISYAAALLLLGAFLALLAGAYPASESISRRNRALVVGSMTFAFGAFFPLAFYATSGLETVLFVLCLVLGARLHLRAGPRGSGWVVYASLAAFLVAALLRPEGIGFLLISIVFLFFKVGRPSGRLLAAIVLALFAYLTALSIRFEYFGSVLPNTYFAKPPVTLHYFAPLWRGLAYVSRFLAKSGVVLLIVFALVIPQDRRKRYAWLYLWAMAGYQFFFIVVVGADVLRFDRFAVPLAPWLYALAGMGFLGFLDGAEKRGRRFARRVVVVGVVLLAAANAAQAVNARARFCFHDWMHSRSHRAIGEMLRDLIPPGAEIVANEIGAVRYHSRRPVIDMLGLTDETVASIRYRSFREFGLGSSEWSARAVTHYLLSRDPECILVPSTEVLSLADKTKHRDTMHPLWYSLLASPNLEDRYRPVLYAEIHRSKYFYVFLRNDIKFPPAHFAVPREECLRVHRLDD